MYTRRADGLAKFMATWAIGRSYKDVKKDFESNTGVFLPATLLDLR